MSGLSHLVHFVITIFFWPWLIVWVLCAACSSSKPAQKTTNALLREQNQLLKDLKQKNMYKNYRD